MNKNITKTAALSVLAVALFAAVIIGIAITPWMAAVVPGALLGVAAVVRAVHGREQEHGDGR